MAETSGISAGGATANGSLPPGTSAKTPSVEVPSSGQPKPQVSQDALAKIKADTGTAAGAKPQAKAAESVDEDPEIETPWGEKLKKSEVARLREVEKNRKKFDAAAHKKFEETNARAKALADREAQLEEALARFDEDPEPLFKARGRNADEWAEQRLAKALERERLTPEQVELREAKAELERVKKSQAEAQEKQKQQRQRAMQDHFVKQYDTEVAQALTDLPGLPKTPEGAHSVIEEIIRFKEQGIDIDTKQAAQIARDRFHDRTQKMISGISDPDEFAELIGPEGMALAQKAWLKRADNAPRPPPKPRQPNQTAKPKQPKTLEQVRAELGIPS